MKYGLENGAGDALITYPYTFKMFKADNPNVSIREDMDALSDWNVVSVTPRRPQPVPSDALTKKVLHGPEVKTAGAWAETWVEVDMTAQEQADLAQNIADELAATQVKADAFIKTFVGMTKAEVQTYVNDEIKNLSSAKGVIEKLAIICLILAKRELR